MPNMSLTKVPMPEQDPNVRNKNFLEVAMGYTEEMAMEEASRCLNCKNKPCVSGCPVNVRIPEFVAKVADNHKHKQPPRNQRPCLSSGKSVRGQVRKRYQGRERIYRTS